MLLTLSKELISLCSTRGVNVVFFNSGVAFAWFNLSTLQFSYPTAYFCANNKVEAQQVMFVSWQHYNYPPEFFAPTSYKSSHLFFLLSLSSLISLFSHLFLIPSILAVVSSLVHQSQMITSYSNKSALNNLMERMSYL